MKIVGCHRDDLLPTHDEGRFDEFNRSFAFVNIDKEIEAVHIEMEAADHRFVEGRVACHPPGQKNVPLLVARPVVAAVASLGEGKLEAFDGPIGNRLVDVGHALDLAGER